jgi:DegV family protein with EDD domain
MMVNVLTDSCSDLSPELIQDHNIQVIRLPVIIDNKLYRDGLDIDPNQLYALVDKIGQLPKTSAPSVSEFMSFFQNIAGESIFVGIGSKFSGTLQNATLAARQIKRQDIRLIDSNNLSTGEGLLVIKAAEMATSGASPAEIEKEILATVPKVHTSFVIDTLDYIYKSGRCTAIQAIFGSMLKIRPIIEVNQSGILEIKEKSRGTLKRGMDSLLENFKKNLPDIDMHRVFITHSGNSQDAQYLAGELKKIAQPEQLCVTTAGATICSHCGPNTIGILYLYK